MIKFISALLIAMTCCQAIASTLSVQDCPEPAALKVTRMSAYGDTYWIKAFNKAGHQYRGSARLRSPDIHNAQLNTTVSKIYNSNNCFYSVPGVVVVGNYIRLQLFPSTQP